MMKKETIATGKLLSVQTGIVAPLFIDGMKIASAFKKTPTTNQLKVKFLGLEGDEQADLTVHGGLRKAIYAYPAEHYIFWQNFLQRELPFGSMGENLSINGILEQDIFIGDQLHFANCILQITEPREPCFKLNTALQCKFAVKQMAKTAFCGFYLSVIKEGSVCAGDSFTLIAGTRQVSLYSLFKAYRSKQLFD